MYTGSPTMLETIGVSTVEELFANVPAKYRFPELKIPKAASEIEILIELYGMALKTARLDALPALLERALTTILCPALFLTLRAGVSS